MFGFINRIKDLENRICLSERDNYNLQEDLFHLYQAKYKKHEGRAYLDGYRHPQALILKSFEELLSDQKSDGDILSIKNSYLYRCKDYEHSKWKFDSLEEAEEYLKTLD